MKVEKFYRCGDCGQPVDSEGNPLTKNDLNLWKEAEAELIYGNCCVSKYEEKETVIITRDMAIDAGDLSLEGQSIIW